MIRAGYIDYFRHIRPGIGRDWYRQQQPLVEQGYATDLIADEAVRIVTEHDLANPLFLYVAFNAPHSPFQPPTGPDTPGYRDLPEKRKPFAEMITAMDTAVGRISKALEAAGMLEQTLLVFSSDNGGVAPGVRSDNSPLRAGKGTVYEGGVRACAFARWPGQISPGTSDDPMHVTDWYPTFVEAAGGKPKKNDLDGVGHLDFLAARTSQAPRDHVLLNTSPRKSAIRSGKWKLVVHHRATGKQTLELFDLSADISETKNLLTENPDQAERLRKLLARYISEAAKPLKGQQQ
jgi:arylsulfatase A-like enzyme